MGDSRGGGLSTSVVTFDEVVVRSTPDPSELGNASRGVGRESGDRFQEGTELGEEVAGLFVRCSDVRGQGARGFLGVLRRQVQRSKGNADLLEREGKPRRNILLIRHATSYL